MATLSASRPAADVRNGPRTLSPYPHETLLDRVISTALSRPDHVALWFKGRRITYSEMMAHAHAFASALCALGAPRGERIVLLLPNCPQFFIAEFGTWLAGGVVSPVNPLYTERELEHCLGVAGARTVVVLSPFYEKVRALRKRAHIARIVVANIKEFLPPATRALFTVFRERRDGHRVVLAEGDLRFTDLLARGRAAAVERVRPRPQDPAILLFTGGTTGVPKAAVGTHHGMLITGTQLCHWFRDELPDGHGTLLQLMPLFHVYGNLGVSTAAFTGRHTLALVPNPRDIDDVISSIEKVRPTFVPGVPTLFTALLEHPRVRSGRAKLDSVRLCISGAAPLMAETKARFEALTGGRIVEGYALTESMMASIINPVRGAHKAGSIGLPLPDVEVRVVDLADGRELGRHAHGEILLRAPQMMAGYWGDGDATRAAFRDGWLRTGDIGYVDDDGYVFLVDRAKDVIKPSGFQVWPREVEEVIATHPAVSEVGVAGVPDPLAGEAVKAWIVLRAGAGATAEEICAHCRENMASYKVPRSVVFVPSLPKSLIGKVLRRELKNAG